MNTLNRKKVLITGASRGIGKSCARLFAEQGCQLFLNCHSSLDALEALCDELTALGCSCQAVPGDIGDPDQVRSIFNIIEKECRGIDILINNAGVSHFGLLSDMSDREWDHLIQTNLSSVFYTCRMAVPHMVSEKSGKIINISSMWGRCGASCEAAYSASKAGIHGLTMALAKELAPSHVQVNAIACGVIDTDMNRFLSSKERRQLENEIPAGRFGSPEEVAQMVWKLTTAPEYLTGQIIGFDGGFI